MTFSSCLSLYQWRKLSGSRFSVRFFVVWFVFFSSVLGKRSLLPLYFQNSDEGSDENFLACFQILTKICLVILIWYNLWITESKSFECKHTTSCPIKSFTLLYYTGIITYIACQINTLQRSIVSSNSLRKILSAFHCLQL